MRKLSLSIIALLALTGCAGAPIVGFGLSAEPEAGQTVAMSAAPDNSQPRPHSTRHVAARQLPKPGVEAPTAPVGTVTSSESDEPGDRATRVMDRHVQDLESAAQRATNSICRGC